MAWTLLHEGQIKNSKVVILHGKIYGSRPYGKLMDRWIAAVNRNVRKMLRPYNEKYWHFTRRTESGCHVIVQGDSKVVSFFQPNVLYMGTIILTAHTDASLPLMAHPLLRHACTCISNAFFK
jgi:hypothetical protein